MKRPPIVTVMGHVDHGKTSLLDALRNTRVVAGESGGITQHTGASQIEYKGKKITFIDTPGHEAFSEMRSRGGKVADIVILVVAANDGVMPQTREAISHAKAANIPIIVAINKIDLPDKNLPKLKGQLSDTGIVVEEYGGDIIAVEVSATEKINLDKLLESIIAVSEFIDSEDSKTNPLKGFVLEGYHDHKRGTVINGIVTNGVLHKNDEILVGGYIVGKIKALTNSENKQVTQVEAGDPCEILGLKELPEPGEQFELYNGQNKSEKKPDLVAGEISKESLDVLLKADTQGTLEAIKASVEKLEFAERKVRFLLAGVGDVKESDVLLASVSRAIVLAFKVGVPSKVKDVAERHKVIVREYQIIYELVEEVEAALEGMFEIAEEKVKGRALIKKLFSLPSGDVIAGCEVTHGRLRVGDSVSIRETEDAATEVFKSKIRNLQFGRDQINTVGIDKECGVMISGDFDKLKEDYYIEVL